MFPASREKYPDAKTLPENCDGTLPKTSSRPSNPATAGSNNGSESHAHHTGLERSLGISWHALDSIASDHNIRSYIHMQNNHSNRIEFFVTEIGFLRLTFALRLFQRLGKMIVYYNQDQVYPWEPKKKKKNQELIETRREKSHSQP